ncbi:MAG: carboxypeptidase regulatory-like domain-containing protein [Candidatus Sericytochromatia bacterium]|nr:carboxypeptidase regulatory-like domain-containing protein [Candidatus Sericytochromatia bacterium]
MRRRNRWGGSLIIAAFWATGCTPTSSTPQIPCGSPPPTGYCCAILWGSLHGTVQDRRAQPQAGVTVTLKTRTGAPLGDCAQKQSVLTDDTGKYAFDTVPFDVPLEVVATSPTLGTQTQSATVVKGPIVYLDFTF